MWTPVVVELDPVADHTGRMLLALEAVTVDALLLQGADDALEHAVLLWAVRGNELLLQTIAAHQPGVVTAGEDQTIVRARRSA